MKYEFQDVIAKDSSHGKMISHIKPGSMVLECGCAGGYMTKYMKEQLNCSVYIVEYNREGFDNAIQYALDGICADLMENEWFEKFSHLQFDYILFTDVLEHLADPLCVLKKAQSLLKYDGAILVSLPNIGHNDVVLKLLNGNWDYTSIGLLDDTHVHFWGINNLDSFFMKAGLRITVKDCSIVPTMATEQFAENHIRLDDGMYAVLKDRAEGEIYQFILVAQKDMYVLENQIDIVDLFPKETAHTGPEALFSQINDMRKMVTDKDRHIQNLDIMLTNKDQHIKDLETILAHKDQRAKDLEAISAVKDQLIAQLDTSCKEKDTEIDELSETCKEQEQKNRKQATENDALSKNVSTLSRELDYYKKHYFAAMNQVSMYRGMYEAISNAAWWKLTKPGRVVVGGIKKLLRSNRFTYLICKGIASVFRVGLRATWQKVKRKLFNHKDFQKARVPIYTPEELEQQKKVVFPKTVKFSILVPLYNTPEKFLREMIQSVLDQTYANWELCLADGSDKDHDEVGKIVKHYARNDKRIVYNKLTKNLGISGNTNACIDMATGDYIALFDHDDVLHPAALFEMMKAICEKNADMIYTDENTFRNTPADAYTPHFKPDYAPDTLRSYNYICHFTAFSRELLEKAGGGFRSEFDGSQDYDLILRLTEKAEYVAHIPKILYYWRCHGNSVASDISAKPYTVTAAKRALNEHLQRVGLKGEVEDAAAPSTYRISYEIDGKPLISIMIPNKDHIDDLRKCLDSIREKSTYQNWEIIVIENNSTEDETFAYYEQIQKDSRIRVVTWGGEFNYSAINNFGAKSARGEYILLLNNDVEIITPDWLEQMLMFAQRKDVGAVGAMMYYPDDTIQHAGVIFGLGGVAGHSHKYFPRNHPGYMFRLMLAQNYSCVTAACVLIPRHVWDAIDGLDESFKVAFNDVDMCMRIRKAGYLVVWTPYAELYHYESKSRGFEDTPEKQKRFEGEINRFKNRWHKELAAGDPYYNPNFTLDREDFSLADR